MSDYKIYNQNNMQLLAAMADGSLHAVVTDCPYGFGKEPDAAETLKAWLDTGYHEITGGGFMGKKWDAFVPQPLFWKEVLRVLKPGGYVLAFFGTRTYDWGTLAIRLAGFEIRDCIQWIYGSGFPKSHDVSKAIDRRNGRFFDASFKDYCNERRKAKGFSFLQINEMLGTATNGGGVASALMGDKAQNELPTLEVYRKLKAILDMDDRFGSLIETVEAEREIIGTQTKARAEGQNSALPTMGAATKYIDFNITAPATPEAQQWQGYGTALKPACELICVARKPLEGTVADNVLKHGCGAINLDECRIEGEDLGVRERKAGSEFGQASNWNPHTNVNTTYDGTKGRFPANVIFDEEAAKVLDEQSGVSKSSGGSGTKSMGAMGKNGKYGNYALDVKAANAGGLGDSGGASRFFYCAKSSKADRNYGCEGFELKPSAALEDRPTKVTNPENWKNASVPNARVTMNRNNHPTVKPIKLMRYLVRLVKTPVDGFAIADFFMGSGTTGVACMMEDIDFIGCDEDESSYKIAEARIAHAKAEYKPETQVVSPQIKLF